MPAIPVDGLTLYYEDERRETVDLVRQACRQSVRLLAAHWGLATPPDCRVYIMTSWAGFVFRSAPWSWKVLLALTLPLWAVRARKIWPLAGGWEQRYGRRRAVGVKPPRLLLLAEKRLGDQLFVPEPPEVKVQSITCHELTHAFTAHLDLPTWLKEGLAMVAVDRYWENATVRPETVARLQPATDTPQAGARQKLRVGDEEALLALYVRGYWLTRYIAETRPGLLATLLSQRRRPDELEAMVADAYGKEATTFWAEIDGELVAHFGGSDQASFRAPA